MKKVDLPSFEERTRLTFQHKQVERIVWQPRFGDWYGQNHIRLLRKWMRQKRIEKLAPRCPDLPQDVYGMKRVEVYDYLDASPRYPGECWPIHFFQSVSDPETTVKHRWRIEKDGSRHHKIITPCGNLTESWRRGSSYPDIRILKKKEDFKPVLYYLKHQYHKYKFLPRNFARFERFNKGRCAKVASPWRTPYNKCIVELAGTKNTMLLMKRYTRKFDEFCEEMERINLDVVMPVMLDSPMEYMSFGDNVDCRNNPPPVYEKYIQPVFDKRAKLCRKAGKFTYAHYDGNLEDILQYLENESFPFDGIEAPTVEPQGDVSIAQFRKALGDKIILLDGIPSTVFLPHFSERRFLKTVEDMIENFAPNLILGVSDEYSPNGLFKRLKIVSEIIKKYDQ